MVGLLLCAVVYCTGCQDHGPHVILYVSADEYVARQVIEAFEQETGIHVLMVGDTEAKKTTGLVERLRAEADKPKADVFWSSEIFMTIELAEEGIFEPYQSPVALDWPEMYRDSDCQWYGFAARARVIVFHPDHLSPDDRPKSWMDLTHEKYKNSIVMADPRFGTTGGHLGAMKAYWDTLIMPGYYDAFIEGLAANNVRLLPSGNAGVVEAVARGEARVGMTDTDDVWAAQARGMNVDLIYPAHDPGKPGGGTLLIPNTTARIRGGPNPEHAKKLIDFLLSETVEQMLAESVSLNIPLGPNREHSSNTYAVADPLRIDFAAAASVRRDAIKAAMASFEAAED